MTIETTAIYRNGKLELSNGATARLTEGMEVRVSISPLEEAGAGHEANDRLVVDPLAEVIGIGASGVTDGAENHDHYVYGLPRKGTGE